MNRSIPESRAQAGDGTSSFPIPEFMVPISLRSLTSRISLAPLDLRIRSQERLVSVARGFLFPRAVDMIFEARSIWIIAIEVIGQHGMLSPMVAKGRAADALSDGDIENYERWLAVHCATETLLTPSPAAGDRVH